MNHRMIVAVAVTVLGLLLVGVVTQVYGYRLGGTIAIPVLAVYTLKNVFMLPVFVLSTVLAFTALTLVKERTLVYGRDLLLVALVVGSSFPVGILLLFGSVVPEPVREVVFVGSILPGLAAYNYHEVKPELRRGDLLTAAVLLSGLLVFGVVLVSPRLTTLGTVTPPVLFTVTADVGILRGAVVDTALEPTVLPRPRVVALFLLGLAASERVRSRFGIRIGTISVALLAVYALANRWLLVLYGLSLVVAFLSLTVFHLVTMLYGRVLISVTTAVSLLAAVLLVYALPITRGLSAYFVAILAGVNAYNWHTSPPAHRRLFPPLQLGTLTALVLVARAVSSVQPRGIPQTFGPGVVLVGVVVVAICFGYVTVSTVDRPSGQGVFEASIVSGGEDG